ncbi:hypothetical protein TorRG33x02_117990 [Trema orientale]|uniref:Uncharacterized protein n=1 Tax=Trema orientale TaxID=63057 RepID=A0A2P5F3V0_TREOI|nr:hypothetical protein TorRG33x02_117990 [Trema orientale]
MVDVLNDILEPSNTGAFEDNGVEVGEMRSSQHYDDLFVEIETELYPGSTSPTPIDEREIADHVLGVRRGHRKRVGRIFKGKLIRSIASKATSTQSSARASVPSQQAENEELRR